MIKSALVFAVLLFAHSAFSAMEIQNIGQAEALNGKILYNNKGKIFVGNEVAAYSPVAPDIKFPKVIANSVVDDMTSCRKTTAKADVPLAKGESIALVAKGDIGAMKNVTAVVVRKKADVPKNDLFKYVPLEVRVFDSNKKTVATWELTFDAYPCALIVDQFKSEKEKQLAFGWVSVGNGYTTGVTLLSLAEKR